MSPLVSFVFPVHLGGLVLAARSVAALRLQTAGLSTFEAIVALDVPAGAQGLARALATAALADLVGDDLPFRCAIVESPRTEGNEHLPHRNHARNAGVRASTGRYVWVLDADMMADPVAVEHLTAVAGASSSPVVLSPCMAEPQVTPDAWLALDGDEAAAAVRAGALPRKTMSSSGHLHRYRPGPPRAERYPGLIEGEPVFERRLWEALGGYDERFIGYGGNKVSLVRALTLLDWQEHRLEVSLLTSCLFVHQPHARDPLRFDKTHRDANWTLFNDLVGSMKRRDPWWQEVVEAVG